MHGSSYTLSPRFCLITFGLQFNIIMEAAIAVNMHDKKSLVSGYW